MTIHNAIAVDRHAATDGVQTGITILIVEDELLLAMDLEAILTGAGHHVVGIAGDRAAAQSLPEMPQIALVDLNLKDGPTGRGVAFDLSRRAGVKIIFVTANPQQIGEPPATAIGYVRKPFSGEAILAAVKVAALGGGAAHGLCRF